MPSTPDASHIINLSRDGTFTPSGNLSTTPEQVDAIFDKLRTEEIGHLVLYFHGGRVSEENGLQTAKNMIDLFQDRVGAHPVFFLWEASELEILRGNLRSIAEQEFFRNLLDILMKFVMGKLDSPAGSRSITGQIDLVSDTRVEQEKAEEQADVAEVKEEERAELEPVNEVEEQQLAQFLDNNLEFQQQVSAFAAAAEGDDGSRGIGGNAAAGAAELSQFSDEVVAELQREIEADPAGRGLVSSAFFARSALKVFKRVVKRMLDKSDHGVYCTVVEELLRAFYIDKVGGWIWGEMKQEVADAFGDNEGRTGIGLHGGTYFLDRLAAYIEDPDAPPLEVSLVGHSAGSIYICRMIERAIERLPESFAFNHVVFLAPGADFKLMHDTIVTHPERVKHFRMYTMTDEFESRDKMLPVIYPRSLLYFVAGLLEGDEQVPIVGMERFFNVQREGEPTHLQAVREYVTAPGEQRVVWSVTGDGTPGLTCSAEHHGGFAEHISTKESLAALLVT